MKRYMAAEGTREEVLAELRRYRKHYGGVATKVDEFAEAIRLVEEGAREAFVDGTLYRVVEE